jgi:hypothetical protein
VQRWADAGHRVLFIGDGVSDLPAASVTGLAGLFAREGGVGRGRASLLASFF